MKSRVRVALAIVSLGTVGLLTSSCENGGLSASSTCKDFLSASAADQNQIVTELAGQYNKPDFATPLGEPDVPYYCAAHPTVTLSEFFAHAGD